MLVKKVIAIQIGLVLALFSFVESVAQDDHSKVRPLDIGFEIQGYLGGFIVGTRFEKSVTDKDAIHIRLGYNVARHRDLGKHEDERGGGPGFTLGYRHYFSVPAKGFFFGVRNDIWFNTIDWKDNIGEANEVSGTTEITVIQPTVEGGYLFVSKNGYWSYAPALAFGFEINTNQTGADVGEGPILLIGFSASYRFQ